MSRLQCIMMMSVAALFLFLVEDVSADSALDSLYSLKKYEEAVEYAESNLQSADRTPAEWVKIGESYEQIEMPEKALACYLVSWRMNPEDYLSLLGAARAYNRLGKAEMALGMAEKARKVNNTAEANWEYALACRNLGRIKDAKGALARVIEKDSANVDAVDALAAICFNEEDWAAAVPLCKLAYRRTNIPQLAFRIGRAYGELGISDSAIEYLGKAFNNGIEPVLSARYMGRAFFDKKKWGECIRNYRTTPDSAMQAGDLYRFAVASEKTGAVTAAQNLYKRALKRFGMAKGREVMLAKENFARLCIRAGQFSDAVPILRETVAADPKGVIAKRSVRLLAEAYLGLDAADSAITILEGAIAANTRNVEAYALLADCYHRKNMPKQVQEINKVLSGITPDDPGTYLTLGNYHFSNKRYSEALRQYERSNQLRNSGAAFEGVAVSAFELGDYEHASAAADSALACDSMLVKAVQVKVQIFLRREMFDTVRILLEKLQSRVPENLEVLYELSNCYVRAAMNKPLVAVDKKIVRLNPSDTASRLRLAEYFSGKDSIDAALKHLRELHMLLPGNTDVLKNLADLSRRGGDFTGESVWLGKYLEIMPDDAVVQRDMGNLLYNQKDPDGALACYRMAMKLDPSVGGFYKHYAEIVIGRGEENEVVKVLRGLIHSGSADVGTYITLGLIAQKQNELIDAIEMYQAALKMDPASREALAALASCQLQNGDIKEAIVSFEQTVLMDSGAVEEYRVLGDLYMADDRVPEAMDRYLKYLSNDGRDTMIARKVAHYMYTQGEMEEVVRCYGFGGMGLPPQMALEYAEACIATHKSRRAISILLPMKADHRLHGEVERQTFKMLAQAYENDSDYTAASAAYGEYLGLEGVDDREAAFKQASLLNINDPLAAQKVYELNCRKYPSDFRNFLNLALIYSMRQDMLKKAIPLLKRVTKLADSLPDVWLELGRIYEKTGNEQEELIAYRNYTRFYPQSVEANRRIGTLLMRKGDYHEGVVFLEIADDEKPDEPEIMTQLAGGYVRTGRFGEAVSLLNRAKVRKKDDPDIRFRLFELYQSNGQKEKARQEIEAVVALSREPRYLQLYAEALVIQGNFKAAGDVLEELLAYDPENRRTLFLKARLFRGRKQYDDAIELYKVLNQMDPTDAMVLFERAEAHREQGKLQWAETFYRRALRADPTLGRAELGLALIAKSQEDSEGYREHLEKARILSPDDEYIVGELKKTMR